MSDACVFMFVRGCLRFSGTVRSTGCYEGVLKQIESFYFIIVLRSFSESYGLH